MKRWFTDAPKAPAGKRRPFRPQLEGLEAREVPAFVTVTAPVTSSARVQFDPATAGSLTGARVAVWAEQFDQHDHDLKGRLTLPNGTNVSFTVANSSHQENQPSVAMSDSGSFVVTWTDRFVFRSQNLFGEVVTLGDGDIFAQRFNAQGQKVGDVITVANSTKDEFDSSVAMDGAGNFVVAHTLEFSREDFFAGTHQDLDVRARRFAANGTAAAGSFAVANSTRNESAASVARAPGGAFAIAFQDSNDVKLKRFSAAGTQLGGTINVAATTATEKAPSLAMDRTGNMVVAWQTGSNLAARRISSGGTVGGTLTVANTTAAETKPAVALHPTNGRFVVAFETTEPVGEDLIARKVKVKELRADNTVAATLEMGQGLIGPAISMNGNGVYQVLAVDPASGQVKDRLGTLPA